MEVHPRLPIDPETQTHGEPKRDVGGQTYTLKVFAFCPNEEDASPRLLGRVKVRPGPVAPGKVAAVRMSDGFLVLRRIRYCRERGREFVCLESLLPSIPALRLPLSALCILGTVIGYS